MTFSASSFVWSSRESASNVGALPGTQSWRWEKMFQLYRFKLLGPVLRIYENRIPPVWYGLPELGSSSASKLSKSQTWPSIAAPLFWRRQAPTEQLDTTNIPTSHADTHTHQNKKNEPTSFVAGTIFPTQLELNRREPPLVKKHAKREVLQTKKDGLNACKRPCRWWHQWWWKWPKLHSSNLHILIFLR